ncbi:Ig-like domain-containing protein [Streptomyces sp. NPDC060194]|uniref:L,D-transpeptidase n=1 Tax=Streptomyces sp. NPDC060194 TaxID=3347069 RepID=UPI00365D4104
MSHSHRTRTVLQCTLLVAALAASATACSDSAPHPLTAQPYDAAEQVAFNGSGGGKAAPAEPLDPTEPLEVTARGGEGRITDVVAVDNAGRYVAGELAADGGRWQSSSPLSAGHQYTVTVSTENEDGAPGRRTLLFETAPAKGAMTVTFGPEAGKYGVGQPVTAELSRPVRDKDARAVVESNLHVESAPAVEGSWHWVDDKTLHYRPAEYWPANATIRVDSTLKGVRVSDKVYGGAAEPLKLSTGDRVEAVTDAGSHRMTVRRNGKVIKTLPVTTGKPGFDTRNGKKVILGREYHVRMTGTSIGIPAGSSESYDLPVYYATRVTWSGEYVHAAPWSVGSQGSANVSHGCTGMSMGNARWFYETVRQGDIVEVVNSNGEMMAPFGNGFGDWNLSWKQWQKGSALGDAGEQQSGAVTAARLAPHI